MTAHGVALADLAGLLADRTRAGFCLALLDGRAWTAGELARGAGVAPSTASEHLDRLVGGGLLVERRQGRHRYLQLAGAHVAELLEDLVAAAGPTSLPVRSLRSATAVAALSNARTCYDHLAGRLGVATTAAMLRSGWLTGDAGLTLTGAGRRWFADTLGADLAGLSAAPAGRQRPLTRACLDWTERRSHLGGAAGAYLCQHFLARGWIRRRPGGRAVRLTPTGETALRGLFDLDPALGSDRP